MMTSETEAQAGERTSLRDAIRSIGPGIVFMLAVVGPQDLVSNSAMGASYGYSALWTLALILAVRYVILETSSRYVLVTGESLLAGYGRVGRWVVWLIFGSLLLKRHLSNLFQILLLGNFAHLLLPLPVDSSAKIWSASLWLAGFLMMYKGRYGLIERISKPLVTLLGATLLVVALAARPDPSAIARGFFLPTIPADQGAYSFVFLLMALAGSTAGSVGSLKYAVFVHEKGWRQRSLLEKRRVDLLVSVTGLFVMSSLMQIAAAAVLRPQRGQVVEVEDLVPLFTTSLGALGRIVLGLGIWAALFNTYLGSNTGYSLMVSQMYYGVLRPSRDAASGGADASHSHRNAYRNCLLWFCLSPVYVLFTDWQPVLLTLLTTALFVVLVPVIVLALLRLTNNRRLMGEYTNGWVTNFVLVFAAATACVLTYQNAGEFWASHLRNLFR